MYQIDEQLMADNRALITINESKEAIDRLLKSGMLNYVHDADGNLFLTIPRSKDFGEYNRLIQELPDGKIPNDLIFKGNMTIEKNLVVLGETTSIDAPNLSIEDNIIEINKNEIGAGISLNSAGIQANRGSKGTANWLFSESTDIANTGAFVFDINGNIKAWIYDTGNLKTLADIDTQNLLAHQNITAENDLTVNRNGLIKGTLTANGAVSLTNTLGVTGATTLSSSLTATGAAWLKSTARIDGASTLNNTLSVVGNFQTSLGGALTVTGAATINNTLHATGAVDLDSTLNVDGNTTLVGTLTNTGAAWLKSTLKTDGATTLSSTLTTVGIATFNEAVQMDKTFHAIGAVDFDSTLNVDGQADFKAAVNVFGATIIDGNTLYVKYNGSTGGQLTVDKHAEFNADVNIDTSLTVGTTLTVGGATTLNNSLGVTGAVNLGNTLTVTGIISSLNNITSSTSFSAGSGNGKGYSFGTNEYKIYMSTVADATYGGRLDSTSDSNMYFNVANGTNRGFIFRNGTDELFQIATDKIYSNKEIMVYNGGTFTQLLRTNQMGTGNGMDVDTVDGYHAANTGGAIPISNSVLNVNLNADMLEGYHGSVAATADTIVMRDLSGNIKSKNKFVTDSLIIKDSVSGYEVRNVGDTDWADLTVKNFTIKGTATGITKSMVGLGNVDNTTDEAKPVSTAQQTALNLKENKSNKGIANGYAGLDANAKIPLNQIPDSVLGQVEYMGTWNASTNTPALVATPAEKGIYYVVNTAGTQFSLAFAVGDWIISNGTSWERVDNTDAVASVAGRTGVITLTKTDVGLANVDNTADSAKPISSAQQTALNLKEDKANKGVANGYASLDANAKILLSQIPDSVLGQVEYMGTWNASTNSPTLAATPVEKGIFYVVNTAGTQFSTTFAVGDWIISNGTTWDKVDNTDAVSSVAGRTGPVILTKSDVSLENVDNTSDINKPLSTPQATAVSELLQGTRNLIVAGGGELRWGVTTNVFAWSKEFTFYPAGGKILSGGVAITNFKVAAGSATLAAAGDCLVITLPTTNGATASVAVQAYSAITGNDKLILAVRDSDSCLELLGGGWIVYGDIVEAGGKRQTYVPTSIITAANDFIVGTGTKAVAKKTLAETKTILGISNVTNESKATMFTSAALTGTSTATTAAIDTNTTQIATTAFVLAQASVDVPNMDGIAAVGNSTRYARGNHIHPTDTSRAPLVSPAFTGTPTGPTAVADTSTTQLATTEFVMTALSAYTPTGGASAGQVVIKKANGTFATASSTLVINIAEYDAVSDDMTLYVGGVIQIKDVDYTLNTSTKTVTKIAGTDGSTWAAGTKWNASIIKNVLSAANIVSGELISDGTLKTSALIDAAKFVTSDMITAENDFVIGTGVGTLAKKTLAEAKTILGINNINNTADSAKPVSTAQQTALNLKLDETHAGELLQGVRNLIVSGGGQLNWGTTANVFTWSKDFVVYPAGGKILVDGVAITSFKVAAGSATLTNTGDCLVITLPTANDATASVAVQAYSAITGTDKLILAVRDVDSCLELLGGGWIVYGDIVEAGGKRQTYVPTSIITAANDFIVGTGAKTVAKKTLAETKTILGIGTATETVAGVVELATTAEATTGTDTVRAVTPAGLKAALNAKNVLGSSTITTTGWVSTTGDFKYYLNIAISGVVADDWVDVQVSREYLNEASAAGISCVEEYAGGITFYATSVPTVAIPFKYKITKA